MTRKKRIVIALGGNALGNTLPEQMAAVKITAHAIVDLIEEGCEVVIAHGNGPQVGMVNNAMLALTHEDAHQPNTPLSVCVAMSRYRSLYRKKYYPIKMRKNRKNACYSADFEI